MVILITYPYAKLKVFSYYLLFSCGFWRFWVSEADDDDEKKKNQKLLGNYDFLICLTKKEKKKKKKEKGLVMMSMMMMMMMMMRVCWARGPEFQFVCWGSSHRICSSFLLSFFGILKLSV